MESKSVLLTRSPCFSRFKARFAFHQYAARLRAGDVSNPATARAIAAAEATEREYGSEPVEVCTPIHCNRHIVGTRIAPHFFFQDDAAPPRYDEEVFVTFNGYQTHCTDA